jgi:hypothetical protein
LNPPSKGIDVDKYDEAIEFLQNVETGSYVGECACLMEKLLARIHVQETPKNSQLTKEERSRLKQMAGGARYYAKAKGLLKK